METLDCDVCVVGAGYAGLVAARRLVEAGLEPIVLEARSRVGGRVWTRMVDGVPLDVGAGWLGAGQDAIYALAKELGVTTYPSHSHGDAIFLTPNRVQRYRGTPRLNPFALFGLALGMLRLDRMAKQLPLEAPWSAPKAREWDRISAAEWLASSLNVPTKRAKELLEGAIHGLFTSDPAEVSLLHVLFLIASAGGLRTLLSMEGGYQQDHATGGAQEMANRMARALGERIRLDSPVRTITQGSDGVFVASDAIQIRARFVVMAIPPALAARVTYAPALSDDRAALLARLPAGSIVKTLAVYDEPFWTNDGLSGESVGLGGPIESTLAVTPERGRPGVLAAFAFGPHGRALGALAPEKRREIVLATLVRRFGRKAASPIAYVEQDWTREPWTEGCSMARFPPGVMTELGRLIREPVGRIHWAGTETATKSHGAMDGAIRSGERAAEEIVARA